MNNNLEVMYDVQAHESILCKMVWHFISLSKVVGEQYIDSSQKHYL